MRSLNKALSLGALSCVLGCVTDVSGTAPTRISDIDDVSAWDGLDDGPGEVDARVPEVSDGGTELSTVEDAGPTLEVDAAVGEDAGRAEPPAMPEPVPPGSRCSCNGDCQGNEQSPGLCVAGLCMTRATSVCSGAGSRFECPLGGTCWGIENYDGYVCWPDCFSFVCDGACDDNGHCVPTEELSCNAACGVLCGPSMP